jgi:hypothetical protein
LDSGFEPFPEGVPKAAKTRTNGNGSRTPFVTSQRINKWLLSLFIAEVLGEPEERVAEYTTQNAIRIFSLHGRLPATEDKAQESDTKTRE